MGLKPGDEIVWIEDGRGGYRVAACARARAAMLRAHEEAMDEYGDVFAALAK